MPMVCFGVEISSLILLNVCNNSLISYNTNYVSEDES